ncbi:MAG TPA: hypothetical protein VMF64_12430 [Steroidobacteraceae bacterium]|nr:hypothetical protein [Steroidobacteraceae bacterium]
MKIQILLGSVALVAAGMVAQGAWAQGPGQAAVGLAQQQGRERGAAPPAEQAAPIDLTGYWESAVTEDWRWRMLTAPPGDVDSVPLTPAGLAIAKQFNPAPYGSGWTETIDCRAYGAAGLMRMPTRVHITWANPNELQIESDWGQQTRQIYFNRQDMPHGAPSAQGSSLADWITPRNVVFAFGRARGPQPKPVTGKLHVITDNLAPGWLRRNGVPYSARTHLTEWYQTFTDPTGKHWFDVTTQVEDPEYLRAPFITSSDFRQEPDASKWAPHPCKTVATD